MKVQKKNVIYIYINIMSSDELMHAIATRDYDLLKNSIQRGVDLNNLALYSNTSPLKMVINQIPDDEVTNVTPDLTKLLLDNGADLNQMLPSGMTVFTDIILDMMKKMGREGVFQDVDVYAFTPHIQYYLETRIDKKKGKPSAKEVIQQYPREYSWKAQWEVEHGDGGDWESLPLDEEVRDKIKDIIAEGRAARRLRREVRTLQAKQRSAFAQSELHQNILSGITSASLNKDDDLFKLIGRTILDQASRNPNAETSMRRYSPEQTLAEYLQKKATDSPSSARTSLARWLPETQRGGVRKKKRHTKKRHTKKKRHTQKKRHTKKRHTKKRHTKKRHTKKRHTQKY